MNRLAPTYVLIAAILGLHVIFDCGETRAQSDVPPRAPTFIGKELPRPPQTGRPWTPPKTKLSAAWSDVVAMLLKHGFADPRGCEYREVELPCGSVWSNGGSLLKTRAWVFPLGENEPPDAPRFAVSWSGIVYPAYRVGPAADLRADVEQPGKPAYRDLNAQSEPMHLSHQTPNALKGCVLLVLGEVELAEKILTGLALPDGDLFLNVAREWGWAHFDRAICAHTRGDDVISLASAQAAVAWREAVEVEAAQRGLQRYNPLDDRKPRPYLEALQPVDALLKDEVRRVAAGPVPRVLDPDTPRIDDPARRVVALVRDLETLDATQWGQPGGVDLSHHPLIDALVKEGEPAIEPLLQCLENDERLTRSVGFQRDFGTHRYLIGVSRAAFMALARIFDTRSFGPKSEHLPFTSETPEEREHFRAAAAEIRAFWNKNQGLSEADRWYAVLADAEATQEPWLEAAHKITASTLRERPSPTAYALLAGPAALNIWAPLRGESLRTGKEPSVSTLLAQRAEHMTTLDQNSTLRLHRMDAACELTLCLARWDYRDALPELRRRIEQCRALTRDRFFAPYAMQHFAGRIPRMVIVGMDAGDDSFLKEYAGWVRDLDPNHHSFGRERWQVLRPIARYPNEPAIRALAAELFSPDSLWLKTRRPLLMEHEMLCSPLISVPEVRDYLKTELRNHAEFGTVKVNVQGPSIEFKSPVSNINGPVPKLDDPDSPRYDKPLPVRRSDFIAWRLSFIEGFPAFESYWPQDRKDAAIAAFAAFLDRHGNAYAERSFANPPQYFGHEWGVHAAKFHIPKLDRVATADDVAAGRAVFASTEPSAKMRTAELRQFPQPARWTPPPDPNKPAPAKPRVVNGLIWQAEEIDTDGAWQRFYGFVGKHDVVRVPAEQVELLAETPK